MEITRELPEIAKTTLAKESDIDLRRIDAKTHLKFAQEQLTYIKTVDLNSSIKLSQRMKEFLK